MRNRRQFLKRTGQAALASGVGILPTSFLPSWARSAEQGNAGLATGPVNNKGLNELSGTDFDLHIDQFPVQIDGRIGKAVGVNKSFPAPLLRFRENEKLTINVTNHLDEDTSIHWHGLLVPFYMDGVPGVSFPGIKPKTTFQYEFNLPQNGTYWYHSHSGFQEPIGLYGPIIIDPADTDPVEYDRDYVLVLSDWSFESPSRIFSKLKKMSENYNFHQRTTSDLFQDAQRQGWATTLTDREMWGQMRMSPRDISDVTGATYTYLINGHSTLENWNGIFNPGERVRLRVINASAMTIFNIRLPGLPMTVVQADGLNVQPLEVDEFQIGVAETYDVIIQPQVSRAYAFVAESIDRSGQVVATFGPEPGLRADVPKLRKTPTLGMKDMGMDHSKMMPSDHNMQMMDHGMEHKIPSTKPMDHSMHGDHTMKPNSKMGADAIPIVRTVDEKSLLKKPGVANMAASPLSRIDEPGIGLENMPHRTLRYSQLRSLKENPDQRKPERELEIHLTGNMERYMWSFDGVKFSEITSPIIFHEGERLRVTLINNTMMSHPIHLHGMFFDLVNGSENHKPRKHTVLVKPAEKLSFDVSADHVGDWAFHCHLLYHMMAGMMQVVSVLPRHSDQQNHAKINQHQDRKNKPSRYETKQEVRS